MGKTKRKNDLDGQPRVRSLTARAAWNRNGGAHGGTSKEQLRRDRKNTKLDLVDYKELR